VAKVDIWMPIYIGDYLGDTMRLTTEQHGAYLLMLMEYWRTGPLPDDDDELAAITKLDVDRWLAHRKKLSRFFVIEDGVWRQKRIERELAAAQSRRKAATENGKKGGRPPKGKTQKKPTGYPNETDGFLGGYENEPEKKPTGLAKQNPEHNPQKTSSPSPSPIGPLPREEVTPRSEEKTGTGPW
jgi:uncharacterized protein YdaU (DUF1376 family)